MNDLKVGDEVDVMDAGLLMLQRFAPPGAKPNNRGTIAEIWEDGTILVDFPLEGDNHSQVAPYDPHLIRKVVK